MYEVLKMTESLVGDFNTGKLLLLLSDTDPSLMYLSLLERCETTTEVNSSGDQ